MVVGRRGEVAKSRCRERQSDPSGPDKAESKTDECGEGDGVWGGRRKRRIKYYDGENRVPRFFLCLSSTFTPFLPSQDYYNSFYA